VHKKLNVLDLHTSREMRGRYRFLLFVIQYRYASGNEKGKFYFLNHHHLYAYCAFVSFRNTYLQSQWDVIEY